MNDTAAKNQAPATVELEDAQTGKDIVDYLQGQHRKMRELFGQVLSTSGVARENHFNKLHRLLAVHMVAEEEVLHPAAREVVHDTWTVQQRLEEEHIQKTLLVRLEKLDVDSLEFETTFNQLRSVALAHAAAEEREEFPQIAANLDADAMTVLHKEQLRAELNAPTHAHPGFGESAMANRMGGWFLALFASHYAA